MNQRFEKTSVEQRQGYQATHAALAFWLTASAGVAVAWWVLSVASNDQRRAWPLAVPPFGYGRVVLAHLLATVPLAWYLSSSTAPVLRWLGRRTFFLLAVATALLAACVSRLVAPEIAERLDTATFAARLVVRAVWSVALLLPWAAACRGFAPESSARWMSMQLQGFFSVLLAVVLPWSYTTEWVERRSEHVEDLVRQNRYWRAWDEAARLADLGSPQRLNVSMPGSDSAGPADSVTATEAAAGLYRQVQFHAQRVAAAEDQPASDANRLARAASWAVLDEPQAARETLGDLPQRNPDAARLLAALLQHERQFDESIHWCRRLIDQPAARDSASRAQEAAQKIDIYNMLVTNLVQLGRYAEAEEVWLEAYQALPDARARVQFELGRFYYEGNRPAQAAKALRLAAQLDPELGPTTDSLLSEMQMRTPQCLLWWTERPVQR